MSAQVAADLRAAADVLERDGWTQDEYRDANGCLCASGAIAAATSEGEADYPSAASAWLTRWMDATAAVEQHLGLRSESVAMWNDIPGRTAAEVIAALRAAADRAEAEQ